LQEGVKDYTGTADCSSYEKPEPRRRRCNCWGRKRAPARACEEKRSKTKKKAQVAGGRKLLPSKKSILLTTGSVQGSKLIGTRRSTGEQKNAAKKDSEKKKTHCSSFTSRKSIEGTKEKTDKPKQRGLSVCSSLLNRGRINSLEAEDPI